MPSDRRRPSPFPFARALGFALALTLVASGCAGRRAVDRVRVSSATPWVLPAAELDTQRLFQARLESDEGRGRFRLLLRLEGPERYQIRATHPLFNRRLWSLDVDEGGAVLVDHHQHIVCRYQDEAEIGALALGPFPFESLPALLLGYLPLPPTGEPDRAPGILSFTDARGRRWTATMEGGVVRRWEAAGEEIGRVAWEVDDDWDVLAADDRELELRLRQTHREQLAAPIEALEVPSGYDARADCDLGWLRAVEDAPWEEEIGEAE